MQNWEAIQPTANYVEHNTWYNNMFATNIKTESTSLSPTSQQQQQQQQQQTIGTNNKTPPTRLEAFLKQQQFSSIESMTAMTPSPNNNNNNEQFFEANNHTQLLQQKQYQQHFQQAAQQAAGQNQSTSHLQLGFNPLTPPGLPNAIINGISHFYTQNATSSMQQSPATTNPNGLSSSVDPSDKAILTPRLTPPMDITPPKSPKTTTTSLLMDVQMSDREDQEVISNSSEDNKTLGGESEYDEYIRMPIYNSHGKMKTHKCKSCGLVAITKVTFWEHTRTHENAEKILQCPKCPFWAKVKHHLEFHICKHKNLKPFECEKCEYSCENKSMLASHRKKHSSVYQYRCADCDYATKFCHAFKQHLRKYEHKPGIVLDEEGIPNPTVVIDVYGTRRGPKNKTTTANCGKRMANGELKPTGTTQLSAALQGFTINHNQIPASPAKGCNLVINDLPNSTYNAINPSKTNTVVTNEDSPPMSQNSTANTNPTSSNLPALLPPLDSLIQQNHNMTFLSYWNLNLQMLAAQQQCAALAQLSPPVKEPPHPEEDSDGECNINNENNERSEENANEEPLAEYEDVKPQIDENLLLGSAIDLSQSTPHKDDKDDVNVAVNLKLSEETAGTPLYATTGASKRKGRVLKLDIEQQLRNADDSSDSNLPSPQPANSSKLSKFSTSNNNLMDTELSNTPSATQTNTTTTTITTTTTATSTTTSVSNNNLNNSSPSSSSSNQPTSSTSSNLTSTASTSNSSATINLSDLFECKYCDIYFKDAVLYTIHMGYHSCDDAFKCNMCGEKCDGPVGLFVHMARNAHA